MMKTRLLHIAAVFTLAMVAALGGCMGKSQPPNFYTLTPVSEGMSTTATGGPARNAAVGIGPVKLADYLDQSRIVTRSGGNRVVQAEFDQWSGSLKDNLTNVLAENISYLLATDRVFIYPWRTYMPVDYQVTVDIIRFDGQPGGEVYLIASWRVVGADAKKLHVMKRTEIREETDAGGYEGLVAAQSRALSRLCHEISQAIQAVERERK